MRQWTFVLPGVELASEVLVFLGSNRSGVVETTWVSPLADDADYGPASKNSQLVGVTLDDWDKNAKLEAFNWGITNFDTFFSACLVVFQSITLEGWVDIMYMTTDASCSFYSFLYLLAVVFIRAFILMNVTLTVAFEELKEKLATQASRHWSVSGSSCSGRIR